MTNRQNRTKKLLSADMPPLEYMGAMELELKRERAQQVMELILQGIDISFSDNGYSYKLLVIINKRFSS